MTAETPEDEEHRNGGHYWRDGGVLCVIGIIAILYDPLNYHNWLGGLTLIGIGLVYIASQDAPLRRRLTRQFSRIWDEHTP